ncbi:MAG: hypothetical protein LBP68_00415 [Acidobacteriota bacterium]|jgi:hypothetical protein|nr:hypothetical protein [Acidobacteriota bacterium]
MVCNVHIEFKRVQTWLFQVPRLAAMVGANALLGETIRFELYNLAKSGGNFWQLVPEANAGEYPVADVADPLCAYTDPACQDNPRTDAEQGILSRDGGHFEALFASEENADAFAKAASDLLRRKLPDLLFNISIGNRRLPPVTVALSAELPVLTPCQWSGRGLASTQISKGGEKPAVSIDAWHRWETAGRKKNDTSYDLASLLSSTTMLGDLRRAEDFGELAGSGYMAVVHADGNGMGSRVQGLSLAQKTELFHRNRVLLRRALKAAIDSECADWPSDQSAPLMLLMLGGDDLLVVCKAAIALPFVKELCLKFEGLQQEPVAPDRSKLLTLGIGVVIAKPTVPIHRLHAVAEHLASSAKRRFRGFSPEEDKRSVVDWAVYTTAWTEDPEVVRQKNWIRGTSANPRVLSRRPMDVSGKGLDSLQGLLDAAQKLEGAPRSQLRYLVEQLSKGQKLTELAFRELSSKARKALKTAGIEKENIWTDEDEAVGGQKFKLTSILDLVEVLEISRLGRAGSDRNRADASVEEGGDNRNEQE